MKGRELHSVNRLDLQPVFAPSCECFLKKHADRRYPLANAVVGESTGCWPRSIGNDGALNMKVVHLMMPADRFAEAVEFYAEGLGLKADTAETGSVVFLVGN